MRQRSIRFLRPAAAVILLCLLWLTSCTAHPVPVPKLGPTSEPTAVSIGAPTGASTAAPLIEQDPLALPAAFRYEVTVRPAGVPDEPATVITGRYGTAPRHASARRGEDAAEDLIVARAGPSGPLWSYTRLAGETTWTRWPGEGFDAGYGLASPFSVLRLYPLADERAPGEADALQGVAESVTKAQAVFTADTVQRLLRAGAFAVAGDPEERSALDAQLTPLYVPQTVTYWAGANDRVHQAARDPVDC